MNTTRRAVLAGAGAAAALAGVIAPAAASAGPDADLVRLYGTFREAKAEEVRLCALPNYKYGTPQNLNKEASIAEVCRIEDGILEQIAELPAQTADGLRVKAAILHEILPSAVDDFDLGTDSEEIILVMSLVNDTLRLHGVSA